MKNNFRYTIGRLGMFLALAAPLAAASCSDDDPYLVREDDSITFYYQGGTKEFTVRSNSNWTVTVPEEYNDWLGVTPDKGAGDKAHQFLQVTAERNRGAYREGSFRITASGRSYDVEVIQEDGNIQFSNVALMGSLNRNLESDATVRVNYSRADDITSVAVTYRIEGEAAAGLSTGPYQVPISSTQGSFDAPLEGTPSTSGDVIISVLVNGLEAGTIEARVLEEDEVELLGLPVTWTFRGTAAELEARQPYWRNGNADGVHVMLPDDLNSHALLSLVDAEGKTTPAINGRAYNDGHAYALGVYMNDYYLFEVPVRNLIAGMKLSISGALGGSGSAASYFLMEYSTDGGSTWIRDPHAITEDIPNGSGTVNGTYTVKSLDSRDENEGYFNTEFTVGETLRDGTLMIRLRVSVNVRTTNTATITTGGSGSNRLKGLFTVKQVE